MIAAKLCSLVTSRRANGNSAVIAGTDWPMSSCIGAVGESGAEIRIQHASPRSDLKWQKWAQKEGRKRLQTGRTSAKKEKSYKTFQKEVEIGAFDWARRFGEIYSAQEAESTGAKYPYVIKVEPHTNGPLFVEMHFYMRNAKPSDIEEFKKHKKLKTFGMPSYLGSGSHEYKSEKYRFIVMEKFGTDLWKIFLENNRSFPTGTVFKLGVQITCWNTYINEDTSRRHQRLKHFDGSDKKRRSNQKGDLEILAYNLIQWLGCALPWERNLKDPNAVHKDKEDFMHSVPKMIKACFGNRSPQRDAIDKPLVFSTSKETPLKKKRQRKNGLVAQEKK
ncbi:hypothetical protein NQ318_010272 [Aromia moschata]|uniref:Uncharacterized protein n=1 Tax=Aromia moschata TaxID=1265417 RepID=A0AAV8YKZ8_9CUCU|nr:hypothetical protein NQ318_010272 [Aromia moschata]